MKNKIINWTFGSIFRRIGSFIAYFIIGLIIALFFVKKDYVKGAEIVVPVEPTNYSLYYNSSGFDCVDSTCEYLYKNMYMLYSGNVMNTYTLTFSNFETSNFDYIELPFALGNPDASEYVTYNTYCSTWSLSNNRYNCTSSSQEASYYGLNNVLDNTSFQFKVDYSDYSGVQSVCFIQNNQIVCPTLRHNIGHLYINVFARTNGVNTGTEDFKFFISRRAKPYISNNTSSAINNQTQQQAEQHNETINTLTNDTTYDENETSNIFEEFEDFLPDEGIVTQLVTLPISLYTNILNSVNGTCSPFSLGSLLGTNLTLPCINVANYLGSQLWSVIDILMSGFFILTIGRKFIKVFENMSSMKEGDVLSD